MENQELVLSMETRPDFLHARASGVRSRAAVDQLTHAVFQTAMEHRLSKVLVDVRELFGYFGFMDIIFLVREVLQDLDGKGVDQLAVIDKKRTLGVGWFLETVAQSYGLNIRVFGEEQPALDWLGG
jgi:hypothetical protein